ncbi:hypothetical protein [Flavobacterium sp.]|uniref:hypothetical protein n=1 Tax=Flavobacterium sp. TaxID=239 RepID=UPI002B4AF603|nr:hypothetical protein [Flavobacterium sp.]HLP65507.1 hypothetical protein [Flavobacterium sp.]
MITRVINLRLSIILIACFFTVVNNFAQTKNIQVENCIREKLNSFFVEKDKLNNKESNGNSVHILEIVEKKVLGYNEIGIYFCSNEPSRQKYLLLKNGNKFKILTSGDSLEIMQEIISFLKKNNLSEEKEVAYLNESIKILDENMNKPSEKKLNKQKWISCD